MNVGKASGTIYRSQPLFASRLCWNQL